MIKVVSGLASSTSRRLSQLAEQNHLDKVTKRMFNRQMRFLNVLRLCTWDGDGDVGHIQQHAPASRQGDNSKTFCGRVFDCPHYVS
jgi:hypothetical protein